MIGATPELLVRRAGNQVSALVLGGTLPRGADPAQDQALGEELLASAKNNEEHAYAGRLDTRGARAAVPGARRRGATVAAEVPEPAAPRHPGARHPGRRP